MRFGLQLGHVGPRASPDEILASVREAERLGFDSVWLYDHVLTPASLDSTYPYGDRYPFTAADPFFDPLGLVGVIAGASARLAIGTEVFVAPYRHPIVLGKALATIEQFAPGRIICGLGAGWMREEFDALGIPYERRGARLAEYIAALRTIWSGEAAAFDGEFYCWVEAGFLPAPTRPIPILVGGHSEIALRRAARVADGWAALPGPGAGASRATYTDMLTRFRSYLDEAGRDPARYEILLSEPVLRLGGEPDPDVMLSGPPEAIADGLRAMADLGATMVALELHTTGSAQREEMALIAEEIAPLVR